MGRSVRADRKDRRAVGGEGVEQGGRRRAGRREAGGERETTHPTILLP
jgi:hypothetical protein